jgi:hypothetical protein
MSSSDTSLVTNHFSTAAEGFVTTTAGSVNSGATTVPLNTTAGLTNGKVFVGIIEPGTSGKEQTFTGLVDTSGSQITNVVWTRGTNTSHTAGVSVVDYVTGTQHNMTTKGMLVEHSQDGTHANITPDSVVTPTATVTNLTVTGGSTFPAGDIIFADLLSTIFSGQVTSAANAGTAGGNFSYINLGGIKLLWGITATISVAGSGFQSNTGTVTFPTSFFSTIKAAMCTASDMSNTQFMWSAWVNTPSTTTGNIYLNQATGTNGNAGVHYLVVGT